MPVFTSSIEVTADYPTIKPSLNLNFARARALDARVTFTRASTATYIGRDGLVKYAGEDEPRFDHDPETLESLGLLIEESRTNTLTYSSNHQKDTTHNFLAGFTTTSHTKVTNIDPPVEGDEVWIIEDATANNSYAIKSDNTTATGYVSYSIFVKKYNSDTFGIGSHFGSSVGTFNLANGTFTNGSTYGTQMIAYPNGWYKITWTRDYSSNNRQTGMNIQPSNGNGVYVSGIQIELGSFPTSYIPTSGSSVTRAVDVAFIPQGPFAEIYNTEESTVLMDVRANMPVSVGNQRNMFHLGNDNNDGFGFFKEGGGLNKFFHIRSGGSTLTNFDSGVDFPYQTTVKFAAAFTSGDQAMYFDDVLRTSTTDTSGLNQSNITIWNIGASNSQGANPLTGTISKMVYYPQRLTNAQLQLLTS